MKRSTYTNYDELPLFLNAEMVAKVLGISISSAYELMHEMSFPALRVGSRIVGVKENRIYDIDIDEALAMKKDINELFYKVAREISI